MRDEPKRGLYGSRPSASADAARRAAIERIWALDVRQRIALALRLGRRCRRLREARTHD